MHTYYQELYHHGVKGQRWGVRRYQNKDGTLTPKGRERQMKQLSKNGRVVLQKGTVLRRVSKQESSDIRPKSKLYVNPDEKEHELYKTMIGSSNILSTGKAYVHEYLTKSDLVIPSVKKQTSTELSLLKDAEIRKEMTESLMKKGMTREQAAKAVKPYNRGKAFLKGLAWTALTLNPIGVMIGTEDKTRKLNLVRASIGDQNNKRLNSEFERKLSEKGYNAYRDTNDRKITVGARKSIVLVNPDKNAKFKSSHRMTAEEYGKAYANTKVLKNKRITKTVEFNDLVNDGKKRFEKMKEQYLVNKYRTEENKKILEEHKKELD